MGLVERKVDGLNRVESGWDRWRGKWIERVARKADGLNKVES